MPYKEYWEYYETFKEVEKRYNEINDAIWFGGFIKGDPKEYCMLDTPEQTEGNKWKLLIGYIKKNESK
jgi:hypothetical protein